MRCSAILLAAGCSRRMGQDKLFLPFGGQTLIDRSLSLLQTVDFFQRIVVLNVQGARRIDLPASFTRVINPHPEQGQGGSVRLGAQAAQGDLMLFCSADQPFLDAETLRRVLRFAREDNIVQPTFGETPGQPVCFGRVFRDELLALEGEEGGRRIMRRHPERRLLVPLDDPLPLQDVDTPASYARLLQIWNARARR